MRSALPPLLPGCLLGGCLLAPGLFTGRLLPVRGGIGFVALAGTDEDGRAAVDAQGTEMLFAFLLYPAELRYPEVVGVGVGVFCLCEGRGVL